MSKHMHLNQPEVTVSIVNYKTPNQVIDCIESILQYNPNFEIIVVDNSNDRSAAIIQKRFPEITLIKNKNIGFGKAHNQAIARAEGKYIAIVNPDIIVEENTFKTLTNFLDKNKKANIVGPALYGTDGRLQKSCFANPSLFVQLLLRRTPLKYLFKKTMNKYLLRHLNLSIPQKVPWISGAFMLMRNKYYFDPHYFMYVEDADLCREVGNVYYLPDAKAIHIGGFKSKKSIKFMFIHLKSVLYYVLKYAFR